MYGQWQRARAWPVEFTGIDGDGEGMAKPSSVWISGFATVAPSVPSRTLGSRKPPFDKQALGVSS